MKKNPSDRRRNMPEDMYKRYSLFRALLWDAVDKKKDISIVELEKRLGGPFGIKNPHKGGDEK